MMPVDFSRRNAQNSYEYTARDKAAGFSAWPALEEELFRGWHLRFTDGFTRRANSANAGSNAQVLSENEFAYIEARFRQKHLPSIFRLCSNPLASGIDDLLAARGYRFVDHSLVMTCPLASRKQPNESLDSLAAEKWLQAYDAITSKSKPCQELHL